MSESRQPRDLARAWWYRYGPKGKNADTGAFARLRRTTNIVDALIEPVTVELVRDLAPSRHPEDVRRAAELATLLAHVRSDDKAPVASRLRGRGDGQPPMSPLRFQKLMKARPGEERLILFRRAVGLLGGRANLRDLAEAWLYFDHPSTGQTLQVNWLLRYAGAARDETANVIPPQHPTEENDTA